MELSWLCEKNEFRIKVLRKNFPSVPVYRDVAGINGSTPRVDLLCGGFPCQPVSINGLQKGIDDDRWLWPEFDRVIGLLRPRYIVIENVLHLRSHGRMAPIFQCLASRGYDAEWESLPAAYFGAPHQRYRVWIVAYSPAARRATDQRIFEPARWRTELVKGAWWSAEPRVRRVDDGLPNWMDRVRSIGDSLVPQIAELIGRRILTLEGEANGYKEEEGTQALCT